MQLIKVLSCALSFLPLITTAQSPTPPQPTQNYRHFKNVLIVIFENMSLSEIADAPAFKNLIDCAKKSNCILPSSYGYAQFTSYYNNQNGGTCPTRTSQPNYIAMTSGSVHCITDDQNHDINVDNLAMQIKDYKKTPPLSWRVYAEDYPSTSSCFTDSQYPADTGSYVRKHVPFLSYTNVSSDSCKQNIQNASALSSDLKSNQLADISFYIPNMINNGHNPAIHIPASGASDPNFIKDYNNALITRKAAANKFLARMLGTDDNKVPGADLFIQFMEQGGLLVITFDEPSLISFDNPPDKTLYTVLAGKMVNSGTYTPKCYKGTAASTVSVCSTGSACLTKEFDKLGSEGAYSPYQCNHYNLLRMIEVNWNLRRLSPIPSNGYRDALPLNESLNLWKNLQSQTIQPRQTPGMQLKHLPPSQKNQPFR